MGMMNSREHRKELAAEHNERIELKCKLRSLRQAIIEKHGVYVRTFNTDSNKELIAQICRLTDILNSDNPPDTEVYKRRIASISPMALACAAIAKGFSR